jgi:hypothetical protein
VAELFLEKFYSQGTKCAPQRAVVSGASSLPYRALAKFLVMNRTLEYLAKGIPGHFPNRQEEIKMKKIKYSAIVVTLGLALMGIAFAQAPETDINPSHHPALADAQHHVVQAYAKIVEAQKANKDQLGGHAEKAIQLLEQANHELKEAAEYADHRH